MFVILDDAQSTADAPKSWLLSNPVSHWVVSEPKQVASTLQDIESAWKSGLTVVALFSYALGEYLQGLHARPSSTPLIEAAAYANPTPLSEQEVSRWIDTELAQQEVAARPSGLCDISPSISREQFAQDVAQIKRLIGNGETYQVNHTFRLEGQLFGNPLAVYRALRAKQPVRFGAFIDTGLRQVLSFSPELFLRTQQDEITAQPMKGTLRSSMGNADQLAKSEKDRAENLMITDLIRNDLGRICLTGSIEVPKLFDIENVGELYQMTSTVKGRLKPRLGLLEIMQSTFPCGSITGAPKRRTMDIIRLIEPGARELYCGSIAHFHRGGDVQMSVAIRTLEVDAQRRFRMGVGSGITIDSDPDKEWQECMAKAAFVESLTSPVGLIETMRLEHGCIARQTEHLDRLQASAKALGIPLDRQAIEQHLAQVVDSLARVQISQHSGSLPSSHLIAVRLELRPNGEHIVTHRSIESLVGLQKLFWAKEIIGTDQAVMAASHPLLRHKTTARQAYDDAWRGAVAAGGFDALFTNDRGEVTEGGRSTVFALIDGQWFTPALKCGVLAGIMRAAILADPNWSAKQTILFPKDIENATRVILVNALRGVIEAELSPPKTYLKR